ncbi:MAG: hypothetical protein J5528_02330 [Firmicutes bacterium]|nr:hypothetical protein [Bacillota bacterium]
MNGRYGEFDMRTKRVLSLVLVLCMVLAAMPFYAFASADNGPEPSPPEEAFDLSGLSFSIKSDEDRAWIASGTYRPEKPQLKTCADEKKRNEIFDDIDESLKYLRIHMALREDEVTVAYNVGSSLTQELLDSIFNYSFAHFFDHTGIGDQGDYFLFHVYEGGVSDFDYDSQNGIMYLTYYFHFYTDAQQEKELGEEISSVLESLDLDGKNAYEKFLEIYTYMTRNIVYDYDNLSNKEYTLKYSAYAALVNKTAVCQGYANLLYRMLLEEGVDCRIIAGTGNGGGHAWNIVGLGDCYYNVDSTWDAAGIDYYDWNGNFLYKEYPMTYMLRCNANFPDHVRNEDYDTDEFNVAYPMSEKDFDPEDLPPEIDYEALITKPDGTVTYYESFTEALEAASDGDELILLKDVRCYGMNPGSIIIDLGGHTLSLNPYADISVYRGEPLIRGGRIEGSESSSSMIYNSQSIILEDLIIDASLVENAGIWNRGTLTMRDCTVIGDYPFEQHSGSSYIYGMEMSGTSLLSGGTMHIEGADVDGMFLIEEGRLHLESGSIGSIVMTDSVRDYEITMAKSGASVGSVSEGYEWKDEGDMYRLSTVYTPVYVPDIRAEVEYNNWLDSDCFELTLYDGEGFAIEQVYAYKDSPYAEFEVKKYILPGTYTFVIKQTFNNCDLRSNIVYDTDPHVVTVTVTADKQGVLHASVDYDGNDSLAIVNEYTATIYEPVTVDGIKATVEFNAWQEGDVFSLSLQGALPFNSEYLQVTMNDNVAEFSPVSFYEPGTYEAYIVQFAPIGMSGDDYIIDESRHSVTVTVSEGEDGNLTAQLSYDGGLDSLTITNTYLGTVYDPVTVGDIKVTKSYNNWQPGDTFCFALDEEEVTVSYDERTAVFAPKTFVREGTYTFGLQEVVRKAIPKVVYDRNWYNVMVELTAGPSGAIASKVSYYVDGEWTDSLTITNTYDPDLTVDDKWAIGDVGYSSLSSAYMAAQDGDTIVLLKDVKDYGIPIGIFDEREGISITIDLNGHGCEIGDLGLGFPGKDFDVVIRNGVISASEYLYSGRLFGVMNSTVTLEKVTIDGSSMRSDDETVVLCSGYGDSYGILTLGEGSNVVSNGLIPAVTVGDRFEFYVDGGTVYGETKAEGGRTEILGGDLFGELTVCGGDVHIESGSVQGIELGKGAARSTVTKAKENARVGYIPADYKWADNGENDILVKKDYAAAVYGTDDTVSYFETLGEAVGSALDQEEVELLKDSSGEGFDIPSGIHIDLSLSGSTYTVTGGSICVPSSSSVRISGGSFVAASDDPLIVSSGGLDMEGLSVKGTLVFAGGTVNLDSSHVDEIAIDPLFHGMVSVSKSKDSSVDTIPEGYEWAEAGERELLSKLSTGDEIEVYDYTGGKASYMADADTVTVISSVPCKLGYFSGGEYIALVPSENTDGSYSFSCPDGVDEVILVVKGDATGDGTVNLGDATRIKAFFRKKTTLTDIAAFAADVTGDGAVNLGDATRITAVFRKKTTLSW